MPLYGISLISPKIMQAVKDLRHFSHQSVGGLKRRLDAGELVLIWDTDGCPLGLGLPQRHLRIRGEMERVQGKGYDLQYYYSSSPDHQWETVSYEQVDYLMTSQEEMSKQTRE